VTRRRSARPDPAAAGCSGLDRADSHSKAAFDLAQQPGRELFVGRVLLFDHLEHFVVNVGEQFQELAVVDSPTSSTASGGSRLPK
jgi:hypothetical protein